MNRRSLFLGLLAGAALVLPSLPAEAKTQQAAMPPNATSPHQADVYLLRGFADIFSTGIDEIGAELQAAGVNAHVQGHAAWRLVLNRIVADQQKNGHLPVVLIGHSLGANAAIYIAEELERRGIAVDYMATFAATGPRSSARQCAAGGEFLFQTAWLGLAACARPPFPWASGKSRFFKCERCRPFQYRKAAPASGGGRA
ncbi:Thioesterase domains of type I polyketide synthase or non-ribosomal peptide synthetase [Brucella canis HSK A52141]|nr:Thioesterase domains of type I polyketide synthase or non-ribosomal peptide synthetase [Brucella canis HSK A52141]